MAMLVRRSCTWMACAVRCAHTRCAHTPSACAPHASPLPSLYAPRARCASTAAFPLARDAAPALTQRGRGERPDRRARAPTHTHTPTHAPAASTSDGGWCGLRADVVAAATELGLRAPTAVQLRAIPPIIRGESVLVAAPTGTGKTLAYVLPLAHALKQHEDSSDAARRPQRPRALIVVPTRELAEQVLSVVKRVCHTAKLRALSLVGGGKQSTQVDALRTPVDVIVATPGRANLHLQNGDLFLTDLRMLVVDEVDTMIHADTGFREELDTLLQPLQSRLVPAPEPRPPHTDVDDAPPVQREPVQVVLAGATISPDTRRVMLQLFPRVSDAPTTGLHVVPTSVEQRFIRVGGGPDAKHDALQAVLADMHGAGRHTPPRGDVPRVLVFCNTVASARSTAHFLVESGGFSTACLHGEIPPALRARQYKDFIEGVCPVLVCTDAAARGLDIPGLANAVLFDFPRNTTDYVHRVGRVGRAGKHGLAVSLVAPRDIELATHVKYLAGASLPMNRPVPLRAGSAPPSASHTRSASPSSIRRRVPRRHTDSARA